MNHIGSNKGTWVRIEPFEALVEVSGTRGDVRIERDRHIAGFEILHRGGHVTSNHVALRGTSNHDATGRGEPRRSEARFLWLREVDSPRCHRGLV